jgi:hypothetical protein
LIAEIVPDWTAISQDVASKIRRLLVAANGAAFCRSNLKPANVANVDLYRVSDGAG